MCDMVGKKVRKGLAEMKAGKGISFQDFVVKYGLAEFVENVPVIRRGGSRMVRANLEQ